MLTNKSFLVSFALMLLVNLAACGTSSADPSSTKKMQSQKVVTNTSSNSESPAKNNGIQNKNGSKPSVASSTKLKGSARVQFDPAVAQAMQYAQKRSTLSLLVPTKPGFSPNVKHLSATALAGRTSYSVTLITTDKQISLNSPVLSSSKYEQMSNLIGIFGGTSYSSPKAAKAQLYVPPAHDLAPAYQSPPHSPSTKVDLGKGIIGTAFASFPMVEWQEGKWTFQVWDGTFQQDVREAKNIVVYLDTHLLPQTYGVFGENIAGDEYHTSVEWVYGNTVYSCFSYHNGILAAQMAASTRVYPGGQAPGTVMH